MALERMKLGVVLALLLAGCGSMEKAAAKDPMKCERDPKCTNKRKEADCSTQCADDPACLDRCRQIQITSGGAGR